MESIDVCRSLQARTRNILRARRTKNLNGELKNEKPLNPSQVHRRDPVNSQMYVRIFALGYACMKEIRKRKTIYREK